MSLGHSGSLRGTGLIDEVGSDFSDNTNRINWFSLVRSASLSFVSKISKRLAPDDREEGEASDIADPSPPTVKDPL